MKVEILEMQVEILDMQVDVLEEEGEGFLKDFCK